MERNNLLCEKIIAHDECYLKKQLPPLDKPYAIQYNSKNKQKGIA